MTKAKTALRMTAQRKLEVYQKTRDANAPIGEILREYGLHLDDLRRIESTVESAALAALKVDGSHHKQPSASQVNPVRVAQLEQEIHEKTQALAELSVALAPKRATFITLEKKDRLSSSPLHVGRLSIYERRRVTRKIKPLARGETDPPEKRQLILDLIDEAKRGGVSERFTCWILEINPRTIQRWRKSMQPVQPVHLTRPAPSARPHNALSRQEAAAVVSIIRSPEHADESCRELALSLSSGNNGVFASHVTIWHYQTLLGCKAPPKVALLGARATYGLRGRQRGRGTGGAPAFDWVSGPNQLWTYDVSYLLTGRRLDYYFLYSLLDFYSRKVVSWLVCDRFVSDEIQHLWDRGLIHEELLNQPKDLWPQAHSDRGTQMRALPTQTYFQKLGIVHTLSRPQTPNDNPRIEAHFSTVKTLPAYPGTFDTLSTAQAYFAEFYPWYNNVHPLTTVAMLTPNQVHSGQGSPRKWPFRGLAALRGAGPPSRVSPFWPIDAPTIKPRLPHGVHGVQHPVNPLPSRRCSSKIYPTSQIDLSIRGRVQNLPAILATPLD